MPAPGGLGVPLLEAQQVSVTYEGGIVGLRDGSIAVGRGEIVALLGRNGSGKTSLLRAIAGFRSVDRARVAGTVRYAGQSITGLPPEAVVRRGIFLVPGGRQAFLTLTVEENLKLVAACMPEPVRLDVAYDLFPRLAALRASVAGRLSGGERQQLGIARAIVSGAPLVMIDELSLGLSPVLAGELFAMLDGTVRRSLGRTVLLVEQNARMALGVVDRAYVLAEGRVMLSGDSHSLEQDAGFRRVFLGLAATDDRRSYAEARLLRRPQRVSGGAEP